MKLTKSKPQAVTTVDLMIEALDKSSEKFKRSKLFEVYAKLDKLGIISKTEYSLPPKDTIGKTFHSQTQFIRKQDQV